MDKTPILIPIGVFAIFIGIFTAVQLARKRRIAAMLTAGGEIGFMPGGDSPEIASIPLFDKRKADFRFVLQGAAGGFSSWIFDYAYQKGKSHIEQTVIAFTNSGMTLPKFELRQRRFADSFSSALGANIVKFPASNPFAERFVVVSSEPDAVLRMFTPELQNYVEGLPETGWTMEGNGNTFALYRRQKAISPSSLRTFVDDASAVAQGFLVFVSRSGQRFSH